MIDPRRRVPGTRCQSPSGMRRVCVERVTWGVELEPKLGEEGGLGVGMIHCRISEPKVGEEGF